MHATGGFGVLAFLIGLWGLVVTILWLVIGWRAMRAHERIADSIEHSWRQRE